VGKQNDTRLLIFLQHNQWRVAKAGGVETIVEAMHEFHDHAMVQLSALLCMIPLALENPMMQVRG
jgi:hypothetical protein